MNIFIVAVKSKDKEFIKELKKDSFTVGRALECDISLNDSHVSRVHLVVSTRGDQIYIEDKNSANGTFLNSAKLIQGTPVNVSANDRIQLGKSEYSLTVKLKSKGQEAAAPKSEKFEPKIEVQLPKVVSAPPAKNVNPQPVVEENTVDIIKQNAISIQNEQLLHEAKRKAAQIVLEGEAQAEKQVQAIHEKARVAREQAENFYQERTAEARKKAEVILDEAQNQGQKIIGDARDLARTLREEIDAYVEAYKEKSKRESEQIIAAAEKTAEKIKSEAHDQGRKAAQQEAAHIVEMAQRQANETQEKAKTKSEELNQLSREFKEIQNKLATANTSLEQARTKEYELRQKIEQEEERIKKLVNLEEDQLKQVRESEDIKLKKLQQIENDKIKSLEANQQELMTENAQLEADTRDLQGKNAQLRLAISDLEEQKNILTKAYEAQKNQFEEKLEKEKLQIEKTEKSYYEEMRLELSKRLEQMEQNLLANIINKKASLIKKIFTVVETETVKVVDMAQWKKLAPEIDVKINETFENELVSLSQSSVNTKKPVDLMKKRESEKHRYMGLGVVTGALLFFGGQVLFDRVAKDKTPMQTLVSKEAKLRQEELQRRQFNPPQVDELKETYTDAVLYTKNFAQTYGNQEFQQNFYKAVSQYLFKTWRIDEDKSIQIVSTANALVQELADKKSKIHPDFVKNSIDKMRTLEQETLTRMRDILGSDVRVESFRTFERKFYNEQIKL